MHDIQNQTHNHKNEINESNPNDFFESQIILNTIIGYIIKNTQIQ